VVTDLIPSKDNTFLVRSLNGMAINTASSPTGVNVNIGGAIQIDGQGLLSQSCSGTNLTGTFEVENGCFYYCDGTFRQSLNAAFNETANGNSQCKFRSRCDFNGIKLRPGERVDAYNTERAGAEGCASHMQTLTCGQNGELNKDYPYSYCMPWDGTATGTINDFHP